MTPGGDFPLFGCKALVVSSASIAKKRIVPVVSKTGFAGGRKEGAGRGRQGQEAGRREQEALASGKCG